MTDQEHNKFILYSDSKVIANALQNSLKTSGYMAVLITGDTPESQVEKLKQIFILFEGPAVLIATSALTTGVDGIDRACNHLIIIDDTRDDSLRRQLIGRVLPRGDYKRETIVTRIVASE